VVNVFFAFVGDWVVSLVHWYVNHQTYPNLAIVAYGLFVAYAHMNLRRIDASLTQDGAREPESVVKALGRDSASAELKQARLLVRIPLISMPSGLWPMRLNAANLSRALVRLHRLQPAQYIQGESEK